MTRWVYPLVPDAQLLQDGSYTHMKRYIYKENGCKISRAASIGDGCVLGKGCVIEGTAVLQRTIVGRDCVVGSGARVTESHLWAGNALHCTVYLSTNSFIYFVCLYSHVLFCFSNWFGLFCLVCY